MIVEVEVEEVGVWLPLALLVSNNNFEDDDEDAEDDVELPAFAAVAADVASAVAEAVAAAKAVWCKLVGSGYQNSADSVESGE
jgi:hypothetical protein